jgi:FkbM family methyltransferase
MKLFNKFIKLVKLLKHQKTRKGLLSNIAANIELEDLVKDLKFKTLFDIGSNKGQFILLIEKIFDIDKNIYSFEPIKEIFEKQKIFFSNKKNISFFNFALGEKSSIKTLKITKRKDSSSFFEINDNIKNTDYLVDEKREIEIKSLDEIMEKRILIKPILAKIDVQGYELEVLKGSKNLLKKIKYIIIELSENEIYAGQPLANKIVKYLNDMNFKPIKETKTYKISGTEFKQKDILFENIFLKNLSDE